MTKRSKIVVGVIAAILVMSVAAYAVLQLTKTTETITAQTANMDLTLGTPTLANSKPISPGDTIYVRVPVTNTNTFPVVINSAVLKNFGWYEVDGATSSLATSNSQLTVQVSSLIFMPPPNTYSTGSTVLSAGDTRTLSIPIVYSPTMGVDYMNKTMKFNLDLSFTQQN